MPATYDEVAAHYDAAIRPLERWFLKRLRQRAFENLPQTGRLLEIGAGTGLNFAFYPLQAEGMATDLSSEMLKLAAAKPRPEAISLVQTRAEQLPFQADSFDAAVATLVFCSIDSQAEAFDEIQRVVKPGGRLVLLDHVRPEGLLGPLFDLINVVTSRLCGDHFNRRTANMAASAGLKVLHLDKQILGIFNIIVCEV